MNAQIVARGRELAEMGEFVTIVPDLYRGKVAKDHEEAGHLMDGLDWAGAVEDIRAAAMFLMGKGCRKVRRRYSTFVEQIYVLGHGVVLDLYDVRLFYI